MFKKKQRFKKLDDILSDTIKERQDSIDSRQFELDRLKTKEQDILELLKTVNPEYIKVGSNYVEVIGRYNVTSSMMCNCSTLGFKMELDTQFDYNYPAYSGCSIPTIPVVRFRW